MDTKHAKIFQYQAAWRESRPEVNLSQLVRQRLTPLIPTDQIPDTHDTASSRAPPAPIIGYGGGAGYRGYETERVHLSLYSWQKAWIAQEPTFSFSVFVQGQLDLALPRDQLPDQRRESLEEIGVLASPEESRARQQQHGNATSFDHD